MTGLPLNDTMIALIAAVLLFVLPGDKPQQRLLVWQDSQQLPWGVLLLFGGGLSMAEQIQQTGVADLLAQQLNLLQGVSPLLILLAVTTLIIFLTEVTSNTATAAAFYPLLGPVAVSMNLSPPISGGASGTGGEFCLYDARRHPAQCHRVCQWQITN